MCKLLTLFQTPLDWHVAVLLEVLCVVKSDTNTTSQMKVKICGAVSGIGLGLVWLSPGGVRCRAPCSANEDKQNRLCATYRGLHFPQQQTKSYLHSVFNILQ